MVVNRQYKIHEFQKALKVATTNPFGLAKIIVVPSPHKSNEQSIASSTSSNQNYLLSNIHDEFGTDWSHIVSSWLEALEASDAVCCRRLQEIACCFVYWPGYKHKTNKTSMKFF
jgi:hypothetical protein